MFYVIAGVFGLVVGSFLNAYVWRTYIKETREGEEEKSTATESKDSYSIISGRSMCPKCEHALGVKDLIPVLSWVWLRGKCRYCKAPISWQYPAVEIITAVLFMLSAWWAPELDSFSAGLQLLVWFAVTGLFIALSVYDIRWYTLPDTMLGLLLFAAVLLQVITAVNGAPIEQWLWQPLAGGAGAFLFFYLMHVLGRGKWMGGGDVKMVFVLGLLVGGMSVVVGLFIAFITAAIVGMGLILAGKRDRTGMVPFGPFLLLGFWVAFFFGETIADWYVELITVT